MFAGRREEYLDMRPPATPLLDVLAQRLRSLDPGIVVQPARQGAWTAYYKHDRLVVLARPAATGTAGAIELALLPVDLATTVREVRGFDDPGLATAIAAAVNLAQDDASKAGGDWSIGSELGAFGVVLLVIGAAVAVVSWLRRARREAHAADATGTQADLAILNAARGEARLRASSLSIGCITAIVVGFVATIVVILVGAWLVAAGVPSTVAAALWLSPVIVPWLVFRRVRTRYPSPPQRTIDRVAGVLIKVLVMLAFLGIVFGMLANWR